MAYGTRYRKSSVGKSTTKKPAGKKAAPKKKAATSATEAAFQRGKKAGIRAASGARMTRKYTVGGYRR